MEGPEENASSLTKPLIHSPGNIRDEKGSISDKKQVICEEMRKQAWLAGPLILVCLLQYCLQLISVMFVGHLGQLALSGASLAISFATVTGFSLLMGMASALDTLCGQSHGAKQYHMLGIHMQRAMLVLMLVCIPLATIWANTGSILRALGQDPDISREAGTYAKFMIPSVFGYAILQCQVSFLQTQTVVFPMMITSAITTMLHLFMCWTLVFKSGLGSKGAAVAYSVSYWVNVVLLSLYIKLSSSCSRTWTGFSREALHNILSFVKLAIPSAVMVCLENGSFEMMVLLSGLLPNPALETSVLSICLNTCSTVWVIPFGLSSAVSIQVSNELGAGRPRAARSVVCVVLGMAMIGAVAVGLVLMLIRNVCGYAYSNETEVVSYVAAMVPILVVSNFMDSVQCVLSGTVRGCGKQKIGALINLGSYYLVGIPMAILLAFVVKIGGMGLWMGIICALVVQVICLSGVMLWSSWEDEAKKAKERVYSSTIPVEILS